MATRLVKTVKPSGQGGDYTSLEACVNANEQNLITADKYFDVEIDGTWSSADTTMVTLHNYSDDATRYINIYTTLTARHKGVLDSDYYFLDVNASYTIRMLEDFVTINGLQMRQDNGAVLYLAPDYVCSVIACNNLVTMKNSSGGRLGISVQTSMPITSNVYIFNNIVYGFNYNQYDRGIYTAYNEGNVWIYNNTVYGCGRGIEAMDTTHILKNNISYNNSNYDYYGIYSPLSTNNLSKDGTAPPYNTYYITKSLTFKDLSRDDYHLSINDTDAIGKGVNTSSEPSPINFDTDIDGNIRGGVWDLGADNISYTFYTTQEVETLPGDKNNLSFNFSIQDYITVSSYDGNRVPVGAEQNKYAVFEFKDSFRGVHSLNISCKGQSNLAPSQSKVVLQIYNNDGRVWDDIQENNIADANSDFTLSGTIFTNLDYYLFNGEVTCRVYQRIVSSSSSSSSRSSSSSSSNSSSSSSSSRASSSSSSMSSSSSSSSSRSSSSSSSSLSSSSSSSCRSSSSSSSSSSRSSSSSSSLSSSSSSSSSRSSSSSSSRSSSSSSSSSRSSSSSSCRSSSSSSSSRSSSSSSSSSSRSSSSSSSSSRSSSSSSSSSCRSSSSSSSSSSRSSSSSSSSSRFSSSSSSSRSSSSSSSSSSRSSSSSSSSSSRSSSSSSSSSCRSSSSSSSSQSPCWVAAEIFGGWTMPKTNAARYYVNILGPKWFRRFYINNGRQIAKFIHNKPILKAMLRPIFEYFVYRANGRQLK